MLVPSIFDNNFMDDFFDDMFRFPYGKTTGRVPGMNVDVQEFDDKYQLDVELPGYAKEDIHADLKNGYLTISAQHSENKDEKDEDGRYIRRERYQGSCQRSFYVGTEVTQEDIRASFKDGVLKMEIPKKEAKPAVENKRYIQIEG